jgi:hypothetical protein
MLSSRYRLWLQGSFFYGNTIHIEKAPRTICSIFSALECTQFIEKTKFQKTTNVVRKLKADASLFKQFIQMKKSVYDGLRHEVFPLENYAKSCLVKWEIN